MIEDEPKNGKDRMVNEESREDGTRRENRKTKPFRRRLGNGYVSIGDDLGIRFSRASSC